MPTKHDSPCLLKAADDEPIFVLRGRDITAEIAIAAWIQANIARLGFQHPKILAAQATITAMRNYHTRKLPD